MTRIDLNAEIRPVKAFLRWLHARYLHKLERYLATHSSACFH